LSAVLTHPDVATMAVIATLEADLLPGGSLDSVTVQVPNESGALVAKKALGVRYMIKRQTDDQIGPWIIVNSPFFADSADAMHPNGPEIAIAAFRQDIRCGARGVEPNDAGLLNMRAKIVKLFTGKVIPVAGGLALNCRVADWPPDLREDNGTLIYSETRVTFEIDTQVT
jgi:hypothetical protein